MNSRYLVAHRGLMAHYPENTLLALSEALQVGSTFIECDVQLSRDHMPMVIHDADLIRTTGQLGSVFDYDEQQLRSYSAGYHERFGKQFFDQTIPSLSDVVVLLKQWPLAKAFVELKRHSLKQWGRELVLQQVMAVLRPIQSQAILISFDYEVLVLAKERGAAQIGWVIERWDEQSRAMAQQLQPDYLFGNYDKLPNRESDFWSGPWQWVIYDVVDLSIAAELVKLGVMVESKDIKTLIEAGV